jgi:hypothetical protein
MKVDSVGLNFPIVVIQLILCIAMECLAQTQIHIVGLGIIGMVFLAVCDIHDIALSFKKRKNDIQRIH